MSHDRRGTSKFSGALSFASNIFWHEGGLMPLLQVSRYGGSPSSTTTRKPQTEVSNLRPGNQRPLRSRAAIIRPAPDALTVLGATQTVARSNSCAVQGAASARPTPAYVQESCMTFICLFAEPHGPRKPRWHAGAHCLCLLTFSPCCFKRSDVSRKGAMT